MIKCLETHKSESAWSWTEPTLCSDTQMSAKPKVKDDPSTVGCVVLMCKISASTEACIYLTLSIMETNKLLALTDKCAHPDTECKRESQCSPVASHLHTTRE